jgi:hypothetical protein
MSDINQTAETERLYAQEWRTRCLAAEAELRGLKARAVRPFISNKKLEALARTMRGALRRANSAGSRAFGSDDELIAIIREALAAADALLEEKP